jgi:membrane carboxypeptidase/penicillin-binding protein
MLILVGAAVLLFVAGTAWLFFYSGDLPDTRNLDDFAPSKKRQLTGSCLSGPTLAVPFEQINANLRDAMAVSEGPIQSESALAAFFRGSTTHRSARSVQIARTLFCGSHDKGLTRDLKELRLAIQLDRRFSKKQLFIIDLNQAWFGDCGVGVENASQCLFQKDAAELNVAEAALLAGLIRSPSLYSPFRHPDKALARRNAVLDSMFMEKKLSRAQLESAKAQGLLD